MITDPTISVLIPAYNEAQYIKECLRSVDEQDVDVTFEILVCDDCSTDDTRRILSKQTEIMNRLRTISTEQNSGQIKACNKLLTEARGTYFVRIDADSVMKSGTLADIYAELDSGQDLVFGRIDVKNTNHLHPAAAQVGKMKGRGTWYGGACIASHIDQFVDSGGFDQEMTGAEVQELKQRAKTLDWSVTSLEESGVESNFPTAVRPVLYRKYDSGRSHLLQYKNTPEDFSIWEIRGPIFWSTFVLFLLCSAVFSISGLFSVLMLCFPLFQYAHDAKLAVKVSGRGSFYILYPLYKVGGGLARTAGIWSEFGIAVEIISNKYFTTK